MMNQSLIKITMLSALITLGGVAAEAKQRGGGGATFEKIDADGNGEVTQEELRALAAERFAAADADADGFVTPAELMAARVGKRAQRMLERYDADGNGSLSAQELETAGEARFEKRAQRMLARIDTNEDGKIALAEMTAARDPAKMFERLDADGNGSLSAEEFAKARAHRGGRK